jgi:hypothetical protein
LRGKVRGYGYTPPWERPDIRERAESLNMEPKKFWHILQHNPVTKEGVYLSHDYATTAGLDRTGDGITQGKIVDSRMDMMRFLRSLEGGP